MATATLEKSSLDDHIREVVAAAPPLSDATLARIVALFKAGR